jgi:tetratricopeptide (TPR) repeat protein
MRIWHNLLAAGVLLAATFPALADSAPVAKSSKATAYYHAAMGHLYAELAAQYGGRGEYLNKSIENYKLALRADPEAGGLAQELADLFVQSGQIRAAVNEFEETVKRNPDDLNARRILGRLYMARIRDGQQNRVNEEILKQAIAQYEKVSEKAPGDIENWLLLGRLHKLGQNSSAAEKAFKRALEINPESEDALTGLAMVYSDLGDTTQASQLLKRVADRSPSLRTLAALAAAYEQMKEFKLAAQTYQRALDLNKDNTDLKRAYAESLFKADDNVEAKRVFDELIGEDPRDILALLRMSQLCRAEHDYAHAREYAKRARELDPANLEILYNEVSLLEAEGKTAEATARLKELLDGMAKRPTSLAERGNRAILLERLGLLYRNADQTQLAVATFREIAELDPAASARAEAQIIDTLRVGKEFAAAEKAAVEARKRFPDDRVLKTIVATLYTDLARFPEAEGLIKTLFDGKTDRDVWISLAQVQEKAKNFAGMAKSLDEAEKLSSANDDKENVYFLRGAMFERQKKFEQAETEFRKALKLNPNSASALNYLGYMLADRNVRLSEALEMIKKAVDLDPSNSAFLDSLGWVYFRLDRLDDAATQLRSSIERGSRDATVHEHLGDVYSSQDRLKDAITSWERAIREWQSNAPSEMDPAEVAKIQKKVDGARLRLAKEGPAPKKH